MAAIWSERATIEGWLRTEAALALAQSDAGVLDAADAAAIAEGCSVDRVDRDLLWREARNVGYPILPLVRQIAAALPEGPNGRVHYGATTQDIMDTTLSMQLGASCDRACELLTLLGDALSELVREHASTVMAGRTHAQQAVPTTFGAKMAVYLDEVRRQLEVMRALSIDVRVVSLFGAGGTSAALGDRSLLVRAALARRLGLADTHVPWHVARGRVTGAGLSLAVVAAMCARFAREVVDLSRTEIAEVKERDGHHRGASSTMPHKINPIASESVVGLAVSASGAAASLLRSMEAGHERAAGEWQIEWVAFPSVCVLTGTALALTVETAASLQVRPEAMARNLGAESGLIMSEAFMMRLAPSVGRERAHDLVYAAATQSRRTGESLRDALGTLIPPELAGADLREPRDYLGEAERMCSATVQAWERVSSPHETRTGPR